MTDIRVKIRGIFKIFSLFTQFIFIVYLVANLWVLFVNLDNEIRLHMQSNHDQKVPYFISNGNDWDLDGLSNSEFIITILYFTFTSLSTVGFGDYYPITDEERVVGAFMLLFGVAIFSYLMGKLFDVLQSEL